MSTTMSHGRGQGIDPSICSNEITLQATGRGLSSSLTRFAQCSTTGSLPGAILSSANERLEGHVDEVVFFINEATGVRVVAESRAERLILSAG